MHTFLPLLSYIIPLLGKGLLMIPFVPNKAIPFVLGAFAIGHKYWLLAGFPTELPGGETGSLNDAMYLAGFGFLTSVVPVVWGIAEQFLFHTFYEHKKMQARLDGKTHWLEQGKKSLF